MMERPLNLVLALAAVVIAAALTVSAYQGTREAATPDIDPARHYAVLLVSRPAAPPDIAPARHSAVLLGRGQACFGKIENLRAEHVVLQDVFDIQGRTNPETKAVSNVLVKRGQEWHSPDRMIVSKRHIMLIEP